MMANYPTLSTPDFRLKVALFGGTFDPIHNGHLNLAQEVLKADPSIEQFFFVPCSRTNGKQPPIASAAQRTDWIRIALQDIPPTLRSRIGIWETELNRGGISYTIDTLCEAQRLGAAPEHLYWVMGADAYLSLPSWKDSHLLRSLCRLIVVDRPGEKLDHPQDQYIPIPLRDESSREIRELFAKGQVAENKLPSSLAQEFHRLLLMAQCPYANV